MPSLNLSVSAYDFGVVNNEGVVFNWEKRMLVFCGGKQVLDVKNLIPIKNISS